VVALLSKINQQYHLLIFKSTTPSTLQSKLKLTIKIPKKGVYMPKILSMGWVKHLSKN
jgi:hypothetical protein